jgi:hypothetical protein
MDKLINKLFPTQPVSKKNNQNKLYELNKESNKKFKRRLNTILQLQKMSQDANNENPMKTYYELVYCDTPYIGGGLYVGGTGSQRRIMTHEEYNNQI